MPKQTKV